jgi:integrase
MDHCTVANNTAGADGGGLYAYNPPSRAARTRKYLAEDPLADLADIDTTPESTYRALTIDETYRLWNTIPDYFKPTYVLALLTGLRANELRSLTRAHLDTVNKGLRLEPAWTKNREPGFQPLPPKFVKQRAPSPTAGSCRACTSNSPGR